MMSSLELGLVESILFRERPLEPIMVENDVAYFWDGLKPGLSLILLLEYAGEGLE